MKRFKQGSKGIEIRRHNLLDQTVSAFRLKQNAHDLNWNYIITPYNGGKNHE